MKKLFILTSTLVFSLFLCCFSASALAEFRPYSEESYKIIDNVVYESEYDSKTKETYYSVRDYFATQEAAEKATEINIVSEIDGIPVKEIDIYNQADIVYIGELLDETYPKVKKITIPDSIEQIEEGAFAVLDGLTSLELPESVKSVGAYAFSGMEKLETVTLPSKVTYISQSMFSQSKKLHTINIKGDITGIGSRAFSGCESLTSFEIPETVESIWEGAFRSTGIKTITIPGNAELKYDDFGSTFENCKSLKTVIFEDGDYDSLWLYYDIFRGCTALEEVQLPENKEVIIGFAAFRDCVKLKKIHNSINIAEIEDYAFQNCGLTEITLSNEVRFDNFDGYVSNSNAFEDCKKLKKVIFETTGKVDNFVLPANTFEGCTALVEIKLPEVEKGIEIGARAFKNCKKLKRIYNLADVTKIGEAAFSFCTSLEKFTIPEGVTEIPVKAFCGASKLKQLNLHDGIKKIGKNAFKDCKKLADINYEGTKAEYGKVKKGSGVSKFDSKVDYNVSYQAPVKNFKAANTANTITLSWSKSSGATGYRVYKKTSSGWKKLTDTAKTKYSIKNLTPEEEYSYAVRSYYIKNGKKVLAPQYEAIIARTYVNETKKLSATPELNEVSLSWSKVSSATGYRVYIQKNGKWKKLEDTKKTTYTVEDLKSGTKYKFAVKTKQKVSGKNYWSEIVTVETKTKPGKVTNLKVVSKDIKTVTLSWKKVEGAEAYRVYVKDGDSWKKVANTSKDTYTVKKLIPDTKYSFAVKAYNWVDGKRNFALKYATVSATTQEGWYANLRQTSATTESATIKWNKDEGAAGYEIYEPSSRTEWKKLDETKKTTYTVNNDFNTYGRHIAVRSYSEKNGERIFSDYETIDLCFMTNPPKYFDAVSEDYGKVRVSWTGVGDCEVYYSTLPDSGFKMCYNGESVGYVLSNLTSGKTYYFRMRDCNKSNDAKVYSDWTPTVKVKVK